MHVQYAEQPHKPPPGFRIRDATLEDVEGITNIWYESFNPSHKFFEIATPDDTPTREWLNKLFASGITAGPGVIRTFVVEDLSQGNKIVAFSRWVVPQLDGNQDVPLPAFPPHWDPAVSEALWGGMARQRTKVMGTRPHWVAEFIAVASAAQGKGLPLPLLDWGIRQANATGLEVYGDASMRGLPVWKHYGFKENGSFQIQSSPERFGTYEIVAIILTPPAVKL
ncbi:hypothetical protein NUW58_g2952 [Xylaria curta]|uniref:Uncharacterized protein n=1 Tax=Xylaria curta TaxID=42375 RepID=A0ACC1PGA5_9PEZI|nr:hypothetical protein NUW58_g2952 [Xylaria curta]